MQIQVQNLPSKEFRVISFSYMLEIITGFVNPEKTPLRTFIRDCAFIRTLRAIIQIVHRLKKKTKTFVKMSYAV